MSTFVSSRTWEGEPRRCRVCRQQSWVEPSIFVGDAPCPRWGTLLWPRDRIEFSALARTREAQRRASGARDRSHSATPARAPMPWRARSAGRAVGGALRSVGRAVQGAVRTLVGAATQTYGGEG